MGPSPVTNECDWIEVRYPDITNNLPTLSIQVPLIPDCGHGHVRWQLNDWDREDAVLYRSEFTGENIVLTLGKLGAWKHTRLGGRPAGGRDQVET